MIEAGKLDRRIQILRAGSLDDGLQVRTDVFAPIGSRIWASFTPISDSERFRADSVWQDMTARFRVRYSGFTAGITAKDRLVCEGATYAIGGIKEVGRREGFEITARRIPE